MSWVDDLAKLQVLHQQGALSDEEFAKAKAALLAGLTSGTTPVASGSGGDVATVTSRGDGAKPAGHGPEGGSRPPQPKAVEEKSELFEHDATRSEVFGSSATRSHGTRPRAPVQARPVRQKPGGVDPAGFLFVFVWCVAGIVLLYFKRPPLWMLGGIILFIGIFWLSSAVSNLPRVLRIVIMWAFVFISLCSGGISFWHYDATENPQYAGNIILLRSNKGPVFIFMGDDKDYKDFSKQIEQAHKEEKTMTTEKSREITKKYRDHLLSEKIIIEVDINTEAKILEVYKERSKYTYGNSGLARIELLSGPNIGKRGIVRGRNIRSLFDMRSDIENQFSDSSDEVLP